MKNDEKDSSRWTKWLWLWSPHHRATDPWSGTLAVAVQTSAAKAAAAKWMHVHSECNQISLRAIPDTLEAKGLDRIQTCWLICASNWNVYILDDVAHTGSTRCECKSFSERAKQFSAPHRSDRYQLECFCKGDDWKKAVIIKTPLFHVWDDKYSLCYFHQQIHHKSDHAGWIREALVCFQTKLTRNKHYR